MAMWVFHLPDTLCTATVAVQSQAARARNLIRLIKIVNQIPQQVPGSFQMYFNCLISPNTEKCTTVLQ